jgi:hypothetical protein
VIKLIALSYFATKQRASLFKRFMGLGGCMPYLFSSAAQKAFQYHGGGV